MSKLLVDEISDADNTGPVTVTDGLIGDVTGTLTGNVTGNLTGNVTGAINGLTPQASNMQPFNRIINGAMTIDQRNAGASYTQVNGLYSLDRWAGNSYDGGAAVGKFSVQQSATAPDGFATSLLVTSLAATADGGNDIFDIEQKIEGFNSADLAFGTASAKTITLSFWVRSSLTGTFGGAVKNNARDRAYPFAYTISSANTFEYKTITIAGDTSGTWVGATSGTGLWLSFGLGVSSNRSNTAGAWAGGDLFSSTGATSVVGTSGATFYITGVQLEAGSFASSFAHEFVGDTLSKCQRYYFKPASQYSNWCGFKYGATVYSAIPLPVTMRATPTFVQTTGGAWYQGSVAYAYTHGGIGGTSDYVNMTGTSSGGLDGGAGTMYPNFTASSEL